MTHWNRPDRPVILASQSPRRRELLARMGVAFTTVSPDLADENSYLRAADIPGSLQELAAAKAQSVAARQPGALVLGMDTVVVLDDRIMGKPRDRADAGAMLSALSGKTHTVFTAAALLCAAGPWRDTAIAATSVCFRLLADREISEYLDSGEYADKAGAYGIQEKAMIFVDSIQGCFYNVVGLPVGATIGLFERYTTGRGTH